MENINFPPANFNIFFPGNFVVKKGDTLYSIAKSLGVSVNELKEANNLKNNNITPGQSLIIPGSEKNMLFGFPQKPVQNKEFSLLRNPEDDFLIPEKSNNYINVRKNNDYNVKDGDTAEKIAKKFSVMTSSLLDANNLKDDTILQIGKTLKIPNTLTAKNNIKNSAHVAEAAGLSKDYIDTLIKLEGFHTKIYTDSNGNQTIGVGHLITGKEKNKYAKGLSKEGVYALLAQDLIDREQNVKSMVGKNTYDKLPQALKDSLIDFVFSRGEDTVEKHPGFISALKEGRYSDAIAKMTIDYTQKEVNGKKVLVHKSGLNKRRLYEMAHACKIFNGNIPKNVLQSAQHVYNQGLYNMKKEFPKKEAFENQKAGYNKEIQELFGDKIRVS